MMLLQLYIYISWLLHACQSSQVEMVETQPDPKDVAAPCLLAQLTVKLCNQLWSQTYGVIFLTIPTCIFNVCTSYSYLWQRSVFTSKCSSNSCTFCNLGVLLDSVGLCLLSGSTQQLAGFSTCLQQRTKGHTWVWTLSYNATCCRPLQAYTTARQWLATNLLSSFANNSTTAI